MNSAAYLQQLVDFILSKPSQPPYFLLVVNILISFACGLPLGILFRQRVQYWSKNQSVIALFKWGNLQLLTPLVGTNIGVWISIASSLEILFGFPTLKSLCYSQLRLTYWFGGYSAEF